MKSNGARGRTPVGVIEDAIWEDAFLSLHEKAVLLALKHHTSDLDIGCWPSQKRLAQRTSMSERMVRKAIEGAGRYGWLRVDRQRVRGGRYLVNVYYLKLPKWHRAAAPSAAGGTTDHRHHVPSPPAQRGFESAAPRAAESSQREPPIEIAEIVISERPPCPSPIGDGWKAFEREKQKLARRGTA
jgi:hypothetical protein